jgi:hypothetical protein
MPRYSYWASAYGHLASYLVMFILSAALGAKYYPIPYKWARLGLIVLLMGVAYAGIRLCDSFIDPVWGRLAVNTVLLGVYGLACWKLLQSPWNRSVLKGATN